MTTPLMSDNDYLSLFSISPHSSVTLDNEDVFSFPLVFYCFVCLLGVSGNGLVVWVAIHEVRKTVSMIWVLNLSLADFTFTALLPFTIAHQALGFHWPFGNFLCKFLSFTNQFNMFSSVFTLTVIALDRCISVMLPVWSQNHRTVKLAVGVSLTVWILAVVSSIPFFLIREAMENEEEGKTYCFYNEDRFSLRYLIPLRFTLAFLMPFIIIAVCYCVITVSIRRRRKKFPARSCGIICMIILAFFICWLPFHVLYLVHITTDKHFTTSLPLATCLAYANSCINPVLYMYAGRGSCMQMQNRIHVTLKLLHKEMSNSGSRSESKLSRAMV